MTPLVALDSVSFSYDDVPAVLDVSLSVMPGDFLGLVGPNGSGKTTLLHLMLGILSPDSGTIELFGEPIETFDDGHKIGYVSQHATDRNAGMPVTVREVVMMGRFAHVGRARLSDTDRNKTTEAMELVGVSELAHQKMNQLSGGQQQRVFIARALASDAELLALDEPTVGVDAESRDSFYSLLETLNTEGLTIVLIEHDIGMVTDRVNRIACLNTELFHHGDVDSFIASDALAEAYGATSRLVHHDH